jgi:adenosylcobinamide-GDP ribazoletransferase
MRELIWAIKFLTIVPIDTANRITTNRYNIIMAWFPLVGVGFGLIQAGFPDPITICLVLLVLTLVTGALHVDGLADTADGVLGGATKERRLEIMRDSRIGTFGATAIVFDYLLRYGALLAIMQSSPFMLLTAAALGLMPVVGRWCQVLAAAMCRYARPEEGTGKAFVDSVSWPSALVSAIIPVGLSFLLLGLTGFWMFLAAVVVALVVIFIIWWRIGGMTGDTLGAVNEVAEIAFLLGFFVFVSGKTWSPLVNFVLQFVKM